MKIAILWRKLYNKLLAYIALPFHHCTVAYNEAVEQYLPTTLTPFQYRHHVSAVQITSACEQ